MKNYFYKIIAVALLFATVSCNKDVPVTSVTLEPETLTLAIDGTATLTATVHPNNATNKAVNWTSSNAEVATVANGTVTAKAAGTATITVATKDGGYMAVCTVTVTPKDPEDPEDPEDPYWIEINGIRWATRNLAAHGKFVERSKDHGALFQWGRKGDGHEQRTSPNYPTNNTSVENGVVGGSQNFDANGQIINTHAAYGKFIKQSEAPTDWRTPQNDALWNAGSETAPIKIANDPCPVGWRLPTQTELASLGDGEWTDTPVAGRRFGHGDNLLFLPAAGCRGTNSGFGNVDMSGYYWSSSSISSISFYFEFNNTYVYPAQYLYRAIGMSVRCVAE